MLIEVLKKHRDFRRLWLAQVVSQLGDWLNRMAALALIGELSGSAEAVTTLGLLFGFELALRLLPTAALSGLAGPVADRLPRKALMVAADLLRALVVAALCLVDEPSELTLLYVLLALQMSLSPFFDAARTASIPNLVPQEDLFDAHAISAATWSTTVALGSFLGGIVVQEIGTRGSFLLDSGTYVLSALFLRGITLPPPSKSHPPLAWRDVLTMGDLRRAWGHVRDLGVAPALAVKCTWGMAGGFLVALSLLGTGRFQAYGAAHAIGMLYAARGVGTAVGPFIARWLSGQDDRAMARNVVAGFAVAGTGYALVPWAPDLLTACLAVGLAHAGGSTIWVSSTVLWQRRVQDAFRGRVHSLDFMAMTLSFSAWGLVMGVFYDAGASIDTVLWTGAGAVLAVGLLWGLLGVGRLRGDRERAPETPGQGA